MRFTNKHAHIHLHTSSMHEVRGREKTKKEMEEVNKRVHKITTHSSSEWKREKNLK